MTTWTNTSRGQALDLLDPQDGDIDIVEIARALSQTGRFAGCTRHYYSTAEHCVLIARWLLHTYGDPALALGGLLHDAAEAYTGDITYPVQQVLWRAAPAAREAYKAMQARLDDLIAARAELPAELLHDQRVRHADLRILLDERRALLVPADRPWDIEEMGPLRVEVVGLPPEAAFGAWLSTYYELQTRRRA